MSTRQILISIVILIIGAFAGYYGNVLANEKNNQLLVQLLAEQIGCLDEKINSGRSSMNDSELEALTIRRNFLQSELDKRL